MGKQPIPHPGTYLFLWDPPEPQVPMQMMEIIIITVVTANITNPSFSILSGTRRCTKSTESFWPLSSLKKQVTQVRKARQRKKHVHDDMVVAESGSTCWPTLGSALPTGLQCPWHLMTRTEEGSARTLVDT